MEETEEEGLNISATDMNTNSIQAHTCVHSLAHTFTQDWEMEEAEEEGEEDMSATDRAFKNALTLTCTELHMHTGLGDGGGRRGRRGGHECH